MTKPTAYAIVIQDIDRMIKKSRDDVKEARNNYYGLMPGESGKLTTLKIKLDMSEEALDKLQKTFDALRTLALNYAQIEYLNKIDNAKIYPPILTK